MKTEFNISKNEMNRIYELSVYLKDEYGFEGLSQKDLIIAFSNSDKARNSGIKDGYVYAIPEDKILDFCLYELALQKYPNIIKKNLNWYRKYTTDEYLHKFFSNNVLSDYILVGNSQPLYYFKKNSVKAVATILEAFIYVLKINIGESAVKKFIKESGLIK